MAPYLAMVGEFRVHYAGFFDPGFGHAAAMGRAAEAFWKSAVMRPLLSWSMGKLLDAWSMRQCLKHPASYMVASIASNYQGQGLKLSKHFK